ncbi:MAG: 4Fe-4S ferredoxin [Pseudomonadota bacterium]|nr:4Fe-4S ferredoxin [Pseudomonadota bacterium]
MKVLRKIIEIDAELCNGCGNCVPGCAEGALQIVAGKARVVAESYCDGLGACIGDCPTGALRLVEREAAPFDEEAVARRHPAAGDSLSLPRGCPSAHIMILDPAASCAEANRPREILGGKGATHEGEGGRDGEVHAWRGESALTHWPVKIRLVPPHAPFLKGADLLVLADCAALAMPTLHRDLIKGKVALMGCPKFDDVQGYTEKFADIFRIADIRSVTTVIMEVPCCSGLPMIVKKGMAEANRHISGEEAVVGAAGGILRRR